MEVVMGYHLSDILPCRKKDDFYAMFVALEKVENKEKLNEADLKSIKQMKSICKDTIELWDEEG